MAARIASVRQNPQASDRPIAAPSFARTDLVTVSLCLLAALTPLAFAAPLFEPYTTPKEVLVLAGTATAALLSILAVRRNSWTFTLTPAWLPVIGLLLIGALSILWSANRSASFEEAQRLVIYILLFAVALQAMRRGESRSLLATALILAGALEAIYVLWQFSFGDPFFLASRLPGKWRTFGTLGNPNWTGEFLAVTTLVSLGRSIDLREASKTGSRSPWPHRLMVVALLLMLLALAATLARGAWLAFVFGAGALMFARHSSSGWRAALKPVLLPLAITGVLAALLVGVPLLANREALDHLLNIKSGRGRIWMWAVTGTMIRDEPLGGYGLGTFSSQFPLFQARTFSRAWSAPFLANASFTTYAHNDYLQLWAELGLFALVLFGVLIWMALKRGRVLGANPVALGCWAALLSLLVNAAVAFPLHLPASLMLFVVLLAVVEATVSKKTITAPRPARIVIVLLISVLCFLAYRSSYHRLVADAQLARAEAAFKGQQWSEAERFIRAAIYHRPTQMDAHAMLGRLHFERREYQDALRAFDRAMSLGFDVDLYEWKATVLERSGQRAEAIATLQELVWLRPDLIWARQRLSSLSFINHKEIQP